ncbi:MAG: 4-hydroxyphenylacetate decarboxylase small subunit [Candidatus Xenobiia bacterium LiM19]
MAMSHRYCRNYAPVDVAKGICHKSKELITADAEPCSHFEKMPRCMFCRNYRAEENKPRLGICKASAQAFPAYEDMVAVTCQSFTASE